MVEATPTYTSPYPQQWIFSPAHLHATPSSDDGTISMELELEDRRRGVDLIRRLCERLPDMDPSISPEVKALPKLSPADVRHWESTHAEYSSMPYNSYVQYAASTYLHRFYMRFALQDFPIKLIAPTCLYLALKTEEVTKVKVRSLAQATKIELGYYQESSKQYIAYLVINEEYLLEALCYDLAIEHPQAILIHAHANLQKARRRDESVNVATGTPIGAETGGKTPASLLGAKTPASAAGGKTPGSGLGSMVDMDMDSPLPRKAAIVEANGTSQLDNGSADNNKPLSQDDAEEILLDLATEILMATLTTPLVVLSKPQVIAVSVYVLAISMMKEQSVHDSIESMDSNQWQDAFLPQDGIKPSEKSQGMFKKEVKDCCAMLIEFHRRGLMQKEVLDDDMDVEPHHAEPIKEEQEFLRDTRVEETADQPLDTVLAASEDIQTPRITLADVKPTETAPRD